MYQYLKSKIKWNQITIRVVWVLLLIFCIAFWYYTFQVFDFTISLIKQFISG